MNKISITLPPNTGAEIRLTHAPDERPWAACWFVRVADPVEVGLMTSPLRVKRGSEREALVAPFAHEGRPIVVDENAVTDGQVDAPVFFGWSSGQPALLATDPNGYYDTDEDAPSAPLGVALVLPSQVRLLAHTEGVKALETWARTERTETTPAGTEYTVWGFPIPSAAMFEYRRQRTVFDVLWIPNRGLAYGFLDSPYLARLDSMARALIEAWEVSVDED